MGILKGFYQGMMVWNKRCSFTILNLAVFILLLFGNNAAFAACVASITATTPTVDFTAHGNGTVTHTKTGLMWKQCSEGLSGANCATGAAASYTWQGALQHAQAVNTAGGFAGFTDWRVPNQKELNSIVEEQCINPAVNAVVFPATVSGFYWSASPYVGIAASVWTVRFYYGYDNPVVRSGNGYVRLVRGGQ